MTTPSRPFAGPLAGLLRILLPLAALALALLAAPRSAHAVGTLRVEQTKVAEVDGRWKLKMTIDLGKVPDINYIPMIFSFTPTVLYERSLTDESPEKPVIIKKNLTNQPAINESMDVGFSDATGKGFKLTKFNFMVRRDRGIEAGEYMLEVRRSSDGAVIGNKVKLILEGDNPVVDRRAISFVPDSTKKKKDDKPKDGGGDKKPEGGDAPADAPADAPPAEPSPPATGDPTAAPDGPDPVEPKQGGCGCELAGTAPSSHAGLALLLALPLAAALRRRRRHDRAA
jgi:MYXO-CTERM domain-containing protein